MSFLSPWWREHGRIWLGLCTLTLLLWQCRFVRCGPNLVPERACESLEYWSRSPTALPTVMRADSDGLVLTKRRNEPTFSATRPLEGLDEVSHLVVTCDASWDNAVPHPAVRWLAPRLVIAGYDQNNRFCAPMDHGVVSAHGSRNWHRIQTVIQLPVDLKKVVLSIDGFGEEGTLRLRGLRVEPIRQRSWFVPATVLLLGAWAWAVSRVLLPNIHGRWVCGRAFVIACGILTGTWFFVFPQGRTMFPSLVGGFVMGSEVTTISRKVTSAAPEPKVEQSADISKIVPAPQTPGRQPRLRTIVPPSGEKPKIQPTPATVVAAPQPVTTMPQHRQGQSLGLWLRDLDRKWNLNKYNLTHFTAFWGIGLFVFGLAGSARIWPLPFSIAVLGEIIPNLIYHTWDRGDWWDVTANLGGLLTSLGLVWLAQRTRRLRANSDATADAS